MKIEELKKTVEALNTKPENKDNLIIVEDQHIIDAITTHESIDSIKGYLEDIKNCQKEIEDSIGNFHGSIERSINSLNKKLENKKDEK